MTSNIESSLLDAVGQWISWHHKKVMILEGRVVFFKNKYWFRPRGVTMTSINPDRGVSNFQTRPDLPSKNITFRWAKKSQRRINRYQSSAPLTSSFENIYIYIHTRICVRATRALDSPTSVTHTARSSLEGFRHQVYLANTYLNINAHRNFRSADIEYSCSPMILAPHGS